MTVHTLSLAWKAWERLLTYPYFNVVMHAPNVTGAIPPLIPNGAPWNASCCLATLLSSPLPSRPLLLEYCYTYEHDNPPPSPPFTYEQAHPTP